MLKLSCFYILLL